jgi:hypothetical protein
MALDKSYLLTVFYHSQSFVKHTIKKVVISNNWQNCQLHTIIDNYFTNAQFNLIEPQILILIFYINKYLHETVQ